MTLFPIPTSVTVTEVLCIQIRLSCSKQFGKLKQAVSRFCIPDVGVLPRAGLLCGEARVDRLDVVLHRHVHELVLRLRLHHAGPLTANLRRRREIVRGVMIPESDFQLFSDSESGFGTNRNTDRVVMIPVLPQIRLRILSFF